MRQVSGIKQYSRKGLKVTKTIKSNETAHLVFYKNIYFVMKTVSKHWFD